MDSYFFKDDKMPYIESRYDKVSDACYVKHSHDTISIGANEDGVPINDIYYSLGFFDQSHFIKSFKKVVAVTPKQYQDKILNNNLYNKIGD